MGCGHIQNWQDNTIWTKCCFACFSFLQHLRHMFLECYLMQIWVNEMAKFHLQDQEELQELRNQYITTTEARLSLRKDMQQLLHEIIHKLPKLGNKNLNSVVITESGTLPPQCHWNPPGCWQVENVHFFGGKGRLKRYLITSRQAVNCWAYLSYVSLSPTSNPQVTIWRCCKTSMISWRVNWNTCQVMMRMIWVKQRIAISPKVKQVKLEKQKMPNEKWWESVPAN